MLANLILTDQDAIQHNCTLTNAHLSFFSFNEIDSISNYTGKYAILKQCLLINDNDIVMFKNDADIEYYQNLSTEMITLIDDADGNWFLKINDVIHEIVHPCGRTRISENCKVTKHYAVVIFDITSDYDDDENLIYVSDISAYFTIDTPDAMALSPYNLYNMSQNTGLTITGTGENVEVYVSGEPNYNILTLTDCDFSVSKFDISDISITYNIEMNSTSVTVRSKDILLIGSTFTYDNTVWIITKATYNVEANIITYTGTLYNMYDKCTKFEVIDPVTDATTITNGIVLTDDHLPHMVEEPGLHLNNISDAILQGSRDFEYKVDDLKTSDLLYEVYDTADGSINPQEYSNIVTYDVSEYDIAEISTTRQLVKNKLMLQNRYKKPIYPYDLTGRIQNLDFATDTGYTLFACDAPANADRPYSRFTNFYTPTILYTTVKSNVVSYGSDKVKLVDGELKTIAAAKQQDNLDMLDPFKLVKFTSASPVLPDISNTYLDSILPTMVPWSSTMLKLACVNDNGTFKMTPVNRDVQHYTDPTILENEGILDEFLWTKTSLNFTQLSESDSAQLVTRLIQTDDDGINGTVIDNEFTPLSLIKLDNAPPIAPIINSDVKSLYGSDQSKPPFHVTLTNGKFSGLYYMIQFVNKTMLENAQQGMYFKLTSTKYAVTIDFSQITGTDQDTANAIKVYEKTDTGFTEIAFTVDESLNDSNEVLQYLVDMAEFNHDTNMCKVLLDKIKVKDENDNDRSLTQTNIDRIIIVPPKDLRFELHTFIRIGQFNGYFTSYNYGSKPFMLLPYATAMYDIDDITNTKYMIVSAQTYDNLRKVTNPVVNTSYQLVKNLRINTSNKSVLSQFGIDTFPCKVTFNNKTYLATEGTLSVSGNKASLKLTIDDRNEYLDSLNTDVDDVNVGISGFVYRRRFMNFAYPSEMIYLPNSPVDTWLKNEILTSLNMSPYHGYIDVDSIFDVESTMKLPETVTCTLAGTYLDDSKGFIVPFDLSGFKKTDATDYVSNNVPFSMSVSKKLYFGLGFSTYTLATAADGNTLVECSLDDPSGNSSFVYPNKSGNNVALDLSTDCTSSFTILEEATERLTTDDIATYLLNNPEYVDTYKQKVTKISTTDNTLRTVNVTATLPNGNINYCIGVFDIRADNPCFKVMSRADASIWKWNTRVNNIYSGGMDLNKDTAEVVKNDYRVTFSTNCAGEWAEVDQAYNATEMRITVDEDDQEDTDNRYLIRLGLPNSENEFCVSTGVNRQDLKRFLYISSTQPCILHVGLSPTIDSSISPSELQSMECINILPGGCRVIPLCTFENGTMNFNVGDVWLSDIAEGTEISIYGIQYYHDDGYNFVIEGESVKNGE